MKIAFYSDFCCERGTTTAQIDYALANKNILKNESVIMFYEDRITTPERLKYISSILDIILIKRDENIDELLKKSQIDLFYALVHGEKPDITDYIKNTPTFVHVIFRPTRPHGTYYTVIHDFLNIYYHKRFPVLPHIVKPFNKTECDLRKELNIPQNSTVIGSYGGATSFSINFVQDSIVEYASQNKNFYFIFMNFNSFAKEEIQNIIFLPGNSDLEYKEKFINTCDAMIHARIGGETFGLAVGEFSIKNKPVITYKLPINIFMHEIARWLLKRTPIYEAAHLMNLGNKALCYKNKKQLFKQFNKIPKIKNKKNWDCFSKKFNAETVIKQFDKIISNK